MAEIRNLQKIGEKWARVTPLRAEDFRLGVESPRRDWANQAIAGKENWKAGITAAAANDSFAKGVSKAGSGRWKEKTLSKGPGRFSEGVMGAAGDFQKGFQPYADVIAGLQLPARFPKGDPRNVERVRAISTALRAKKLAGGK